MNINPKQYRKQFLTLPVTEFVEYYNSIIKHQLQIRGLWENKEDEEELVKDYRANDLILTKEKLEKINAG